MASQGYSFSSGHVWMWELDCEESWVPKNWCFWTVVSREALATSCEELTHWKRPWCWQGVWAGGEGDDRGLDGWMTSPTWWTWVWVNSGSWRWTGSPGVLQFMGPQKSDTTEWLNWTESCLTLRPMGLPRQELLEWGAISFSRGSFWPRDWTRVSHTAGRLLTFWATRALVFIHSSWVSAAQEGSPLCLCFWTSCWRGPKERRVT